MHMPATSSRAIQITRFLTGAPVVARAGRPALAAPTEAEVPPPADAEEPVGETTTGAAAVVVGAVVVGEGAVVVVEATDGKTVVVAEPVPRSEPT
jgi:hypothetical protein